MKSLLKTLKTIATTLPFFFLNNHQLAEEEEVGEELETTIDKIFLTSQPS